MEDGDTMQQFNFFGSLERNKGATVFFVIEKTEETHF